MECFQMFSVKRGTKYTNRFRWIYFIIATMTTDDMTGYWLLTTDELLKKIPETWECISFCLICCNTCKERYRLTVVNWGCCLVTCLLNSQPNEDNQIRLWLLVNLCNSPLYFENLNQLLTGSSSHWLQPLYNIVTAV